jgi:hypothetical protein
MRREKIERYGIYRYAEGRTGRNSHRVIALDPELHYWNADARWLPWTLVDNDGSYSFTVTRTSTWRETARMYVAAEVETQITTTIDPATGEPWTDAQIAEGPYWHRKERTLQIDGPTIWVPFAAQLRDLKEPWADWLVRLAEEERVAAIHRADLRRRDRLLKIEQDAAAVKYREKAAAEAAARDASQAFYDRHVKPPLHALGFTSDDITYDSYRQQITLSPQTMERLIGAARADGADEEAIEHDERNSE